MYLFVDGRPSTRRLGFGKFKPKVIRRHWPGLPVTRRTNVTAYTSSIRSPLRMPASYAAPPSSTALTCCNGAYSCPLMLFSWPPSLTWPRTLKPNPVTLLVIVTSRGPAGTFDDIAVHQQHSISRTYENNAIIMRPSAGPRNESSLWRRVGILFIYYFKNR